MSKFSKPKPAQADIEQVIQGAGAIDNQKPIDQGEVRFTMTLPGDMASQIDIARKRAGGLTRLAWIRLAVAEKLTRDT